MHARTSLSFVDFEDWEDSEVIWSGSLSHWEKVRMRAYEVRREIFSFVYL